YSRTRRLFSILAIRMCGGLFYTDIDHLQPAPNAFPPPHAADLMIDCEQARELVAKRLAAYPAIDSTDEWIVLDDVLELPWGWVFFYNSRTYLHTGNIEYCVAGNPPFIVRRDDGAVFVTGT